MKLSNSQLTYIKERRAEMDKRELEIRRMPDEMIYGQELGSKERDPYKELIQMAQEHSFFNYMIQLHNIELRAEKLAQKVSELRKESTESKD